MAALGDVYARQMRVELAKKTYHRVVKAMPADTRTLFKLSALHAWLGALNHGEHMPHRELCLLRRRRRLSSVPQTTNFWFGEEPIRRCLRQPLICAADYSTA